MMTKSFLALITYGLLVQTGLVSARLRVLTKGPDACSARKQAALQTALADALKLVDAAVDALDNPEVVNSRAFLDFLGKGNPREKIRDEHFLSAKRELSTPLVPLSSTNALLPDNIVFICPPDKDELTKVPLENPLAPQSTETCRGTFFALTRNGPPTTIIRLCPIFFDKRTKKLKDGTTLDIEVKPLETAKELYLSKSRIGGITGLTILHEFQHVAVIVGNPVARDLESDVDPIAGPPPPPEPGTKDPKVVNPAYSVDQCKGLPDQFKTQNAQNFAWFAFDVFADKDRGLPCGTPPSSPVTTGSGSSKPASPQPGSPKPPAKPITRRAKTTTPKAPVVAAPGKAPKPAPAVAKPPPASGKPAPVAVKPVPPAAAKPKPNPLGGGTVPSGPRLARPARLSSSVVPPKPSKASTETGANNGAKVGTGAKGTSTGVKKPVPTPAEKVAPAPVCKIIQRGIIQLISIEGVFVP